MVYGYDSTLGLELGISAGETPQALYIIYYFYILYIINNHKTI
jgi:hypothetical protein